MSRQGKIRLTKWFETYSNREKGRITRELSSTILSRAPKMCNFVEWKDKRIVYKRYASLYFLACVDKEDNELLVLEQIHLYVEILDRYFGNVCELDIIFNFHKAYFLLDELFIGLKEERKKKERSNVYLCVSICVGGEIQETSKAEVLRVCSQMDEMMEEEGGGDGVGNSTFSELRRAASSKKKSSFGVRD